jgi:gamma-glutamyltranspeptidase
MMTDSSRPMTVSILSHRRNILIRECRAALSRTRTKLRQIGRHQPQGIVATSQALAAQAGVQMLTRGGSAVDAAIAANAVLAVMEPDMNGVGGDLFVLYWAASTSKLAGLNASGPAPKGLTPDFLNKAGIQVMPTEGIRSRYL